jgi:diacylglycerol O-acyltransferase
VTRADRLSALDAIFLPMETSTQSLHVGSVLVLEGPAPDPTLFREHVATRVAAVPILRRRVRRMPLDLGRPIWVDATGFDPADQVHHAVLPAPGDESQLRGLVAQLMAPRLDAERPLWEVWQVDGLVRGRWAVVAKAHHTMVDGQSGVDVVRALLTDAPDGAPPRPAVDDPRPTPSLLGLAGDLLAWLVALPLRGIRLVVWSLLAPREARRRVEQLRFGLAQLLRPDLPPSILNGPLSSRRVWGWAGADLADVSGVARTVGCTVNDVFLAAHGRLPPVAARPRGGLGRSGAPGDRAGVAPGGRAARQGGEPLLGHVRGAARPPARPRGPAGCGDLADGRAEGS